MTRNSHPTQRGIPFKQHSAIYLYVMQSKQNESELPVFNLIVCYIWRAIFCSNSHQNWTYDSWDIANLLLLKTIKYKGNWILVFAIA